MVFLRLILADFSVNQSDVTVTIKGDDKGNIFKIADFTKATIDGKDFTAIH